MKNKKKTIRVKQAFEWHFAFLYFEMFRSTVAGEILKDEEFQKRFSQLTDYVNNKIKAPYEADTDIYIVLEQQIDN